MMQAYHELVSHLLNSGEPCVFDGCKSFPVLYLIQNVVGEGALAPVCQEHWRRHLWEGMMRLRRSYSSSREPYAS